MYEGNIEITGKIVVNHKQVSLKNREFNYKHEYFGDTSNNTELYKTASCGISGFATVGGSSEDAPSILHDLGWRKGRSISKNCIDNCHAEKKEVMDYFGLSPTFCGILRKLILYGIEVPSEAPLTTVKLGPLVFATLPGEFTFTHQYRFEQRMKNIDDTILDSILLGLSNSYISYFTTHSEYELQHYEGSSTLYGKYSAYLVIQELENLINNKTVIDNSIYSYNHTKLGKKLSLPKKFSKSNNCYKDLDNMLLENNVFSEIIVVPPTYDKYPKVRIEHKNNSRWKLLNINNIPQTSEHLNIISILRMKNKNVKAWEVIWLVPNDFDIDGIDLRFNIKADTDRLVIINEKHNIIKNTIIPSLVSNIVSSFINKFSSHTLKIDNKPYNIPLSRDINIEEVKNVKLLTYNTHLLFTYSSEKRLDVMINNILSIDADIVCLQEVFQVNYKYRIIESLINEYPYYVCCNNKDKDWIDENSGLLTLSKYPITDSKFKKYNDRKWHDSYATKGVLATTIDIGKELYVFNTHLQTMYNTKNSYIKILTKQLNEINSLITEYSKDNDRIILVGDLNINGYTKYYNMLEDSLGKIGLKDIGINSKISTTNDGHERLDYIWLSEKLENEYYKVKNLTSLYGHCSDHKVLITNIVSI
jgi:endonuclease/exonuclease/phosphatase family metal-dependent hydrolase